MSCIVFGTEQPVWTSTTHPSLLMDASNCGGLWTSSPPAVVTSPSILGRCQYLRCGVVFCVEEQALELGRGNLLLLHSS